MTIQENEILVLRACGENGESHGGFHWPLTVGAVVEAPDWEDTDECGHGLHGLPWGEGWGYCNKEAPVWLVLGVDTSPGNYWHGGGKMRDKCKFRQCRVWGVYRSAKDATDEIKRFAPAGSVVSYSYNFGGNDSYNSGGHYSRNSGGDCSRNSGGNDSRNSGGHLSRNSGGYRSHNSGGDCSHNSGGYHSHNSGGYDSRCDARYGGHVMLGRNACAAISWNDGARERVTVLYSGEDGIEPGAWYRLDSSGIPSRVQEEDLTDWQKAELKNMQRCKE